VDPAPARERSPCRARQAPSASSPATEPRNDHHHQDHERSGLVCSLVQARRANALIDATCRPVCAVTRPGARPVDEPTGCARPMPTRAAHRGRHRSGRYPWVHPACGGRGPAAAGCSTEAEAAPLSSAGPPRSSGCPVGRSVQNPDCGARERRGRPGVSPSTARPPCCRAKWRRKRPCVDEVIGAGLAGPRGWAGGHAALGRLVLAETLARGPPLLGYLTAGARGAHFELRCPREQRGTCLRSTDHPSTKHPPLSDEFSTAVDKFGELADACKIRRGGTGCRGGVEGGR
jgi:hypothetical protein